MCSVFKILSHKGGAGVAWLDTEYPSLNCPAAMVKSYNLSIGALAFSLRREGALRAKE